MKKSKLLMASARLYLDVKEKHGVDIEKELFLFCDKTQPGFDYRNFDEAVQLIKLERKNGATKQNAA